VPFVLDASITASWHFEDERSPQATAVLDALARDTAIVPAHWWFEIRNVLLIGERRGRASQQQTAQFLDRLAVLRIELAEIPDEVSSMNLARRHRLTFYDAVYLELAQRERIALATLDDELVAAARAEGVKLIVAAP
jgi:predicted nucleic acid-binding protein